MTGSEPQHPSVVLWTGPFRGKWIPFRPAATSSLARITCLKCGVQTVSPAHAGWYYRRSKHGRFKPAQLCGACVKALPA